MTTPPASKFPEITLWGRNNMDITHANRMLDMNNSQRPVTDSRYETRSERFGRYGRVISMLASSTFALGVFFLIFGKIGWALTCGGLFLVGILALSWMAKTIMADDAAPSVTVPDPVSKP